MTVGLSSGFTSGIEIVVLIMFFVIVIKVCINCMADLTFVKDIFSRKTLVTLLICIFENDQGASQCEEVVAYRKCVFLSVMLSRVTAQLTRQDKS